MSMTDYAVALHNFFSAFGIPAYNRNKVPDDVILPYITYDITMPEWRQTASVSASVWYKGPFYVEAFKKVDEIQQKVGEGLRVPAEGGSIYIYADDPFAQTQPTEDDTVVCVYLLFGVHALL